MRLSENFTLEELAVTKVAAFRSINLKEARDFIRPLTSLAVNQLEPARAAVKASARVNSGFRGLKLNANIGGSKTSQHCFGMAADLVFEGFEDRAGQIAAMMLIIEAGVVFGQLLLENGCIHISAGTKRQVAEYSVLTKTKTPIPELVGWLAQTGGTTNG